MLYRPCIYMYMYNYIKVMCVISQYNLLYIYPTFPVAIRTYFEIMSGITITHVVGQAVAVVVIATSIASVWHRAITQLKPCYTYLDMSSKVQ